MIQNPFDEQYESAIAEKSKLTTSYDKKRHEINWYESTVLKALLHNSVKIQTQLEGFSLASIELSDEIQSIELALKKTTESIGSRWNPTNWFDSHQQELRELEGTMKSSELEKKKRLSSVDDQIIDLIQRKKATIEEIERYSSFDLNASVKSSSILASQLSQQKEKVKRIAERKQKFDDALAPIVKQISDAAQKKSEASSVKHHAQLLDDELSNANNSYERASVHQICEEKFGISSPRKLISIKNSEIRKLDRDLEKLYNRAKIVTEKAAWNVEKLILDGNNLCYQGDKFIGLSALKVLVPYLANDYEVVLVFDGSIRRALGSSDSDIRVTFHSDIEVHVVATSVKADETVLDLAGTAKTTFIVSNDRFAEFGDKSAVQEQRIIRHEIVSGQVLIHDLGIRAEFNQ
ncbi:hypothetical protein [uncultured Shewanella sp.]|uniref:hypothetical protein n=1 Tax=uncultured Shewanella sp. TaxID=173975 RepID=UPI00261F758C|nr:hypothetical protein [uncultured Shewanella sp.]